MFHFSHHLLMLEEERDLMLATEGLLEKLSCQQPSHCAKETHGRWSVFLSSFLPVFLPSFLSSFLPSFLSSFLSSLALLGLQLRPEAGIQFSPINYKDDLQDGGVDKALDKTRTSKLT